MNPVKFPESNITFAKNQPEYLPLPAYRDEYGRVITCWQLSWKERIEILFKGKLWLNILTFGMRLQPQLLLIKSPFERR